MTESSAESRSTFIGTWLLIFCAVTAPVCNALLGQRIPLLHRSTLLIFLAIAIVAALYACVTTRAPRFVQAVLVGLPVVVFIDVVYGGNTLATLGGAPFLSLGLPAAPSRYLVIAIAAVGICVLAYLLAGNAAILFGAVFSAILASTLVLQDKGESAAPEFVYERVASERNGERSDGAPVIVLLFDELMSVGALPDAGVPKVAADLKRRITDFHAKYGFRLYTNAYSRHYWTRQSIPAMLNVDYERTSMSAAYLKRGKHHKDLVGRAMRNQLVANAIFEEYGETGYEISVYQSDIMFFCHDPAVTYCATLDSFNPLSRYTPVDPSTEWLLVLQSVVGTVKNSYFVNFLQNRAMTMLQMPKLTLRFDVHSFMPWFAGIKERILGLQSGTFLFAHVLVPHAPYLLNEDCSLGSGAVSPYALSERFADPDELRAQYEQSYRSYYRQLNCVYSELESLLAAIESNPHLRDATIVVTGDHGSRISKSKFVDDMDARDLIDNYAAHFSIRAPGVEAGTDETMIPVQRLLGEHLAPSRVTADPISEHTVLADIRDKPDLAVMKMVELGGDSQ